MEQDKGLKQMESTLSLLGDHLSVLTSKLDGLLSRAHRISSALENNPKAQIPDTMFGYDLQNFRRDVRAWAVELGGISTTLGSIERNAHGSDSDLIHAQSVLRIAARLQRAASALQDQSLLAHQNIRSNEHKVTAWYLLQEIEALVSLTQPLAGIANKIVIAIGSRPQRTPDASSASAFAAKPRAPVPMRFVPMRPVTWTSPQPAEN